MDKTSLGDRMKAYENVERKYLPRRVPMILRLDGVHFHSFTKGFERPFDVSFLTCMRNTMLQLCQNISGAKLGYTQSDEITILITDDDTIQTQPWFNKNVQKIVSVSAAMATNFFNREMRERILESTPSEGLRRAYNDERLAFFDARVFVVPREEVMNVFEWRQQDCRRNSILSVGQTYFSPKQLDGLSCAKIVEKLASIGINWNEYFPEFQNGVCAIKEPQIITHYNKKYNITTASLRDKWTLDKYIPIFHEHPEYINNLVYHKEENK